MTAKRAVPTDEQLGRFARQQADWFERARKGSLDIDAAVQAIHGVIDGRYPVEGDEFELTIDFDSPGSDPMNMVYWYGHDSPGWKFKGRRAYGVHTRRFRLVRVGDCSNLDEVQEKLAMYGEIPEGQWRQSFMAKYRKPDGNGSIGFADPSWIDPDKNAAFPTISSSGYPHLIWVGHRCKYMYRWLMPATSK